MFLMTMRITILFLFFAVGCNWSNICMKMNSELKAFRPQNLLSVCLFWYEIASDKFIILRFVQAFCSCYLSILKLYLLQYFLILYFSNNEFFIMSGQHDMFQQFSFICINCYWYKSMNLFASLMSCLNVVAIVTWRPVNYLLILFSNFLRLHLRWSMHDLTPK